jgi:hypothetical protein
MVNLAYLDVAIGVVFIFLSLSIIVTWAQELLATLLAWRSKHLINYIQTMLDPTIEKIDGVKQLEKLRKEGIKGDIWENTPLEDGARKLKDNAILAFYEHPTIQSLSKPKGWAPLRSPDWEWLKKFRKMRFPSYIPAEDFSKSLLDILKNADPDEMKDDFQKIRDGLKGYLQDSGQNDHNLKLIFDRVDAAVEDTFEVVALTFDEIDAIEDVTKRLELRIKKSTEEARKTAKKVEEAQKEVEAWFNNFMDRASGWYKRNMRVWAIFLGMIVAMAFNADSIRLTTDLWEDQALRNQIVAEAIVTISEEETPDEDGVLPTPEEAKKKLYDLGLPIGWHSENLPDKKSDNFALDWFVKIIGWFITGLAISQGSSFWFDMLNKLVGIRDSGTKPEEKKGDKD